MINKFILIVYTYKRYAMIIAIITIRHRLFPIFYLTNLSILRLTINCNHVVKEVIHISPKLIVIAKILYFSAIIDLYDANWNLKPRSLFDYGFVCHRTKCKSTLWINWNVNQRRYTDTKSGSIVPGRAGRWCLPNRFRLCIVGMSAQLSFHQPIFISC